jgi:hypothetical protein
VSRVAAIAAIAWLAGGCATVTTGTTQPINIDSDPQGAECRLMREGQTLATVTTPQQPTIKRHAATLHVTCRKDGFEEGRVVLNSRYESSSTGNVLVGGIIGMMVDASSGANSRYDSYVLVRMTPLGPAGKAMAAARPAAAPVPQATAAAVPATPAPSGPWKATSTLVMDRSALSCARSRGSYSLDLTNDMLTVDSAEGRMFSVTVPVDGSIKQSFKAAGGGWSGTPTYEMVGNARTRELEVINNAAGCRWKLTPEA